jgi:hypothetical protein
LPTSVSIRVAEPRRGFSQADDKDDYCTSFRSFTLIGKYLRRSVNGVMFPFRIVKAVNGVPVDEWEIEKYKVNPDLKPKRFEKK